MAGGRVALARGRNQINFYFPIGDAQGSTRNGNPKTNPNG
tara:strand:+ start:196 stop:315 length:120 start_codon:yes stop_codon:yes gene_type:complete